MSFAAVALAVLMGISNVSTFDLMSNPAQAPEEAVAVTAAEHNVSAGLVKTVSRTMSTSPAWRFARTVAAADKDHGSDCLDTFTGFPIWITAADRSVYVVTSDEDFQAVVAQPQVYHVEYLLVPAPAGRAASTTSTNAVRRSGRAVRVSPPRWRTSVVRRTGSCTRSSRPAAAYDRPLSFRPFTGGEQGEGRRGRVLAAASPVSSPPCRPHRRRASALRSTQSEIARGTATDSWHLQR